MRLKVSYKTPESLLGEFTRSVGRGLVSLESRKAVPVGTRFVFELSTPGVSGAVEVAGQVVEVRAADGGKHLLQIRYDPSGERAGIDAVLGQIFAAHEAEKIRRHPRIPIHVRAPDASGASPAYVVRDLSRGGVGLEVEGQTLPPAVKVGQPFLLEFNVSFGLLLLHGEVAWVYAPPAGREGVVTPSFGVSFGKLRADTLERLDHILTLQSLPPPPWGARVSLGMDAVARMP